jgi:MtrB/PioB family decaheme-associated outer membrane protein
MNLNTMTRGGLASLMALLLPGAQAARAVELAGTAGFRATGLSGSQEKFNEYRDVRDGLFIEDLRATAGEDYILEFEAQGAGFSTDGTLLRGDRYTLEGGRPGKLKWGASFDRTPHNFSRGRYIHSGMGTGTLGVSAGLQAGMQANEQTRNERDAGGTGSTLDTTGEDATQQGLMRNLLANTDEKVFSLERKTAAATLDYNVTERVKTWVKASQERRDGVRQLGTGSYERYVQGATNPAAAAAPTHTEDQFVVLGQAVAEPVAYKTTRLNVGAGYYDRKLSGDFEYTLTDFRDDYDALTWANPFRNTDAAATNATDGAANNYNRARFAQGRLALPPSHRSHDVAASGSVELPLHGRLTAAAGFGTVTQDADFLPFTSNSAIAGAAGGGGPADVTSVTALPTRRFDGKVRTLSTSLALALKPLEGLSTKLKYRNYAYDNRSPEVGFSGYSAFGESYWRTVKNDKNEAVRNTVVSYNRQTAEAGAEYELFGPLSVGAETFWDRWDYRNNRVKATDEVGVGGSAELDLTHLLKAHGKYRWAHRAVEDYRSGSRAGNPEAYGLANFNWADRVRNRFDAGLRAEMTDTVFVGLSGLYQDDALGRDERFGYKNMEVKGVTFDVTAAPTESFDLSLTVGTEERVGKIQNAAKDDAFDDTTTSFDDAWAKDNFSPLNYWNTEIKDKTDTVTLDATWRASEKWEFGGGYSLSYGRTSYFTSNPNSAEAIAAGDASGVQLLNALAKDWPTMTSRLHEVRVGATYKLRKDVSFGLDYAFANYMLSDFANVGEYVSGTNAGENATRFVLTGADKYGYTAHVVGAKVRMRF